MKPKQLIILGAVLSVLVAAVFFRQQIRPAELSEQLYAPLDFSFDPEAVRKIDIARPKTGIPGDEEYVELTRQDGTWRVDTMAGARADEKKVADLLKEIREATGEIRGRDRDLFPDFGIESEKAFRITLKDAGGKEMLAFHIGLVKSGRDAVFVRRKDSDDVYLTNAYFYGRLGIYTDPASQPLDTSYWVSTVMFDFETDAVTSLQTTRYDAGAPVISASVARKDGAWSFMRQNGLFAIDGEKVTQHLDSLKNWRAQRADDSGTEDPGFAAPAWEMKIGLQDGSEIVAVAGRADPEKRSIPIRVSTEPVFFHLSGYYFENMDIDDSRFFTDNPLGVDPEGTRRLVIRAGKQNFTFDAEAVKQDAVKKYLEDLKSFRVKKILFDPSDRKKVKSPGESYFEILGASAETPVVIDVGKKISDDSRDYAAARRGGAFPFELDGALYKKLFENLERLKPASGN